jgi:hypothetical protein
MHRYLSSSFFCITETKGGGIPSIEVEKEELLGVTQDMVSTVEIIEHERYSTLRPECK